MTRMARTLALAAAVSLLALPAQAQSLNTGASGAYGQVELEAGFLPDPHLVELQAAGPIDMSAVNGDCVGYVTQDPSFSLDYTAGEYSLFIAAVSDGDATLTVRAPDGSWACDDDGAGALNPLVAWEQPQSGRYQIWVGRWDAPESMPAVLHISEIGGPEQLQGGGGAVPDLTLDPTSGVIDLVSGFEPDPHSVEVAAGGEVNVFESGVEGCVGFIAQAPSYRVNFTPGQNGWPLIFSATSEAADTVLVINDAEGNWVCNDDSNGFDPMIAFESPMPGQYDIWVGVYGGEPQPAVLSVSEIP